MRSKIALMGWLLIISITACSSKTDKAYDDIEERIEEASTYDEITELASKLDDTYGSLSPKLEERYAERYLELRTVKLPAQVRAVFAKEANDHFKGSGFSNAGAKVAGENNTTLIYWFESFTTENARKLWSETPSDLRQDITTLKFEKVIYRQSSEGADVFVVDLQ